MLAIERTERRGQHFIDSKDSGEEESVDMAQIVRSVGQDLNASLIGCVGNRSALYHILIWLLRSVVTVVIHCHTSD